MMSEAMLQALTMGPDEQRERMRRMREIVRDNNVFRWAGSMLLDAARLRKRSDLDRVTALYDRPAGPTGDNVVSMFERKQAVGFR
jgi:trehalose-6-phosphate synthase